MLVRTCLILLLGLGASLFLAGCPSCPYDSQCEGNVLHTCSLGVDQMVGDPSRTARECADPNPVCVNLDEVTAMCAVVNESDCDESFEAVCEDGLVVSCSNGFRVAEDCLIDGNECFELEDGPRCALDPLTECDYDSFDSFCSGDTVIKCDDLFVRARDCTQNDPAGLCVEYENEYGRSAYCD